MPSKISSASIVIKKGNNYSENLVEEAYNNKPNFIILLNYLKTISHKKLINNK